MSSKNKLAVTVLSLVMVALLSACSQSRYSLTQDVAPTGDFDASKVPDAVPVWEPISSRGNASPYTVRGVEYNILDSAQGYKEEGIASWYGLKFHGELTSNGEVYNMYSMSAAHKSLPLPTYARVKNLANGLEVVVRINDRGPFHEGRIIDLSYAAAKKLDVVKTGTAKVEVEAIVPAIDPESIGNSTDVDNRLAYFVQVAALSNKEKAGELLSAVKQLDIAESSFLIKSTQGIFRLRVGPINTEIRAQELVDLISEKGIGRPIAIQRSLAAKGS